MEFNFQLSIPIDRFLRANNTSILLSLEINLARIKIHGEAPVRYWVTRCLAVLAPYITVSFNLLPRVLVHLTSGKGKKRLIFVRLVASCSRRSHVFARPTVLHLEHPLPQLWPLFPHVTYFLCQAPNNSSTDHTQDLLWRSRHLATMLRSLPCVTRRADWYCHSYLQAAGRAEIRNHWKLKHCHGSCITLDQRFILSLEYMGD